MELLYVYLLGRQLKRERTYRDPLDPLHVSDEHLLKYYRMPRQEIITLCQELSPHIQRPTRRNHAIPTHTQVLATLRFLGSKSLQGDIADDTGLTQSTVSRIVSHVTHVLYDKGRTEVKMPANDVDINKATTAFSKISGFPRVIGVVDGTHIAIKPPENEYNSYVNNKGFTSLNLQVVCNADQMITGFCVKFPGSAEDEYVWHVCSMRRRFEAGHFKDTYLLGDRGYPLEPFLMTPFDEPATEGERQYNTSHSSTREVMEQTLQTMKSRFRRIHQSSGALQYEPIKCAKIAAACMWLHNRCVQRRIPLPEDVEGDTAVEEDVDDNEVENEDDAPGYETRRDIVEECFP